MPANFPSNPRNGQTFAYNDVVWTYNAFAANWIASVVGRRGGASSGTLDFGTFAAPVEFTLDMGVF
jgi:hypothetical protein